MQYCFAGLCKVWNHIRFTGHWTLLRYTAIHPNQYVWIWSEFSHFWDIHQMHQYNRFYGKFTLFTMCIFLNIRLGFQICWKSWTLMKTTSVHLHFEKYVPYVIVRHFFSRFKIIHQKDCVGGLHLDTINIQNGSGMFYVIHWWLWWKISLIKKNWSYKTPLI